MKMENMLKDSVVSPSYLNLLRLGSEYTFESFNEAFI